MRAVCSLDDERTHGIRTGPAASVHGNQGRKKKGEGQVTGRHGALSTEQSDNYRGRPGFS